MTADLQVQPPHERGKRHVFVHQRAQDGEQQGHQQRGGTRLAGDVTEGDDHRAVRLRQDVVEVAADGVGWLGEAERLDVVAGPRAFRQHRALNLARDLEVTLERQAVRHLEQHQQVEQQETAEQPERAIGKERSGHPEAHEEQRDGQAEREDADALEQLEQPDHRRQERNAVDGPPRRRQAHREGHEEGVQIADGAAMPGEPFELGGVHATREEAIGLRRFAREQLAQVLGVEVLGVSGKEVPRLGARRHSTGTTAVRRAQFRHEALDACRRVYPPSAFDSTTADSRLPTPGCRLPYLPRPTSRPDVYRGKE